MSSPPDTDWRYGVYLFPLPLLLSAAASAVSWLFVSITSAEPFSDADALAALAAFALNVVASWTAVLFGVVVAVAAVMDARALDARGWWSPDPYALGGVGVVHLLATQFLPLGLLSVPILCYYVYRRRGHVP